MNICPGCLLLYWENSEKVKTQNIKFSRNQGVPIPFFKPFCALPSPVSLGINHHLSHYQTASHFTNLSPFCSCIATPHMCLELSQEHLFHHLLQDLAWPDWPLCLSLTSQYNIYSSEFWVLSLALSLPICRSSNRADCLLSSTAS